METTGNASSTPFHGVGVALVTLFNTDKTVDFIATAEHAQRLTTLGVSAVLVGGTAGEFSSLTNAERDELLSAVSKYVNRKAVVIAGIGAPSTSDACRLAMAAQDNGADCALSTPIDGCDLRDHYESIHNAAPKMPLLAYHWPAKYPPGIPTELINELPVVGSKDSTGDPKCLLDAIIATNKPLYVGSSSLPLLAGAVGATGVILGQANYQPELCLQAFTGNATAQIDLHATQAKISGLPLPQKLKQLTAERFGTPTITRI